MVSKNDHLYISSLIKKNLKNKNKYKASFKNKMNKCLHLKVDLPLVARISI